MTSDVPMSAGIEEVIRKASVEGRVCPQPQPWNRMWEMLPERRRKGGGWEPPAPLILAAWWHASDAEKRERFHLHLRWASDHGCLDEVNSYLRTLQPQDWHTES